MNDEAALPGRPDILSYRDCSSDRRRAPGLHLEVALEELPVIRLVAESLEDEVRLRRWLASPAARRRLFNAMLDGLNELAA